ncbi:hypothetical protein ACFX14_013361 [Malus domestica]|uniref:Uncharacterized protein n=1 Tax=Malus domestica TaxID=3750 RepID=A0A498IA43_MALDO|nr:hypothetical protein DVH24_002353 [Malus domestica]
MKAFPRQSPDNRVIVQYNKDTSFIGQAWDIVLKIRVSMKDHRREQARLSKLDERMKNIEDVITRFENQDIQAPPKITSYVPSMLSQELVTKAHYGKPHKTQGLTQPGILEGSCFPKSTLQISDAIVHQVFIDNESEGNMLFGGMAERMGVLHKVNFRRASIQTFDGTPLYTIGTIKLMVQAKPSEHLMNFHVMDCPSPNNTILSREWLHRMGKIPLANSPFPAI